jgi:hypothetical protein
MNKLISAYWLRITAIVLIAGAFGPFPYVYFQLMNWIAGIAALAAARDAKAQDKTVYAALFVFAAIIFNPIAPIYLSADQWRIADIAAILLFAVSMIKVKRQV